MWLCSALLCSLSHVSGAKGRVHLEGCLGWLILCVNLVGPWCPDMWSYIIPDVPVRVFLDEINIYHFFIECQGSN